MSTKNLDLWFLFREFLKRNYVEGTHTHRALLRDGVKFIGWMHKRHGRAVLGDWTVAESRLYCQSELHRGAAPATVSRNMATLRAFANQLKAAKVVETSPMRDVDFPSIPEPLRQCLDAKELGEVRAVIRAMPEELPRLRTTALFETGLSTGLRASELTELTTRQYRGDYFVNVRVKGRGGRYRNVFVPSHCRPEIENYIRVRPPTGIPALWVKISRRAVSAFSDTDLRRMFQRLSKDVGFRIHPHLLRHTSAQSVADATRDPRFVQKHLGNVSLSATSRYIALDADQLNAVLERGRIGERTDTAESSGAGLEVK